jgi:hypothetical protein
MMNSEDNESSESTNNPKKREKYNKYDNKSCNNSMTFEECELAILRHAVDENEKITGEKTANSEDIKKIIEILENFLTKRNCICYGGTAINALLPTNAQFYNKNVEIPDYDFYTPYAMDIAIELADLYYKSGYHEVEAKAGVHSGTYKVFVNFIPIADVTYMNKYIYDRMLKDAITIAGIKYAPVNFLRMGMYLELSRPMGDISRWEKILKRLNLLNKYHPLKLLKVCKTIDFHTNLHEFSLPTPKERSIDLDFIETNISKNKNRPPSDKNASINDNLYYHIRDSFIEQGAVFIGGYATSLYRKYLPISLKNEKPLLSVPDFDVIIENPTRCSLILREKLRELGFENVHETVIPNTDDVIPTCYEIRINKKIVANIFSTIGCHSYNKLNIKSKIVNVATIDTIMSFYLAFYFSDRFIYFRERILCMAKFLFELEKHNRLNQHGLLKRFTMTCVGKQKTVELIRSEKNEKFKQLKFDKNSKEYKKWFLNYRPDDNQPIDKLTVLAETLSKPKLNLSERSADKLNYFSPNRSKIKPILKNAAIDSLVLLRDDKNKTKKRIKFKKNVEYEPDLLDPEREQINTNKHRPRKNAKKHHGKTRRKQVKKYVSEWMNRQN